MSIRRHSLLCVQMRVCACATHACARAVSHSSARLYPEVLLLRCHDCPRRLRRSPPVHGRNRRAGGAGVGGQMRHHPLRRRLRRAMRLYRHRPSRCRRPRRRAAAAASLMGIRSGCFLLLLLLLAECPCSPCVVRDENRGGRWTRRVRRGSLRSLQLRRHGRSLHRARVQRHRRVV